MELCLTYWPEDIECIAKKIFPFVSADVLGEDAIIQWYKNGHSPKGKSVFLSQMEKMVTWLQNAEEETSEEEDEEDDE